MVKSGPIAAILCLAIASRGQPQVSVQGSLSHERVVAPGESFSGVIVVKNSSAEPQEARLYQTDYATTAAGITDYADPGSLARSNARWVTLAQSRVIVPPNQTVDVRYTVTIPSTATLSGTYWSVLMVEGIPRGSAESGLDPGQSKQRTLGLRVRFRSAVRVVTHIDTDIKRDIRFEAPTIVNTDVGKELQVDVVNTGNRGFLPLFRLELYSEDGTHVKTVSEQGATSFPGMSIRQRFDIHSVPSGRYRAIVTVDAGGDAVFGAQYSFTL
jgi:hypothetical protein